MDLISLMWFYCNANNCKIKKPNIDQYVKLWYSMCLYFNVTYWIKYNTFLVSFQAFMIWLITWITKYTKPSRTAAMSIGQIVDTCAKLSQTHMYMESD